MEDSNGRTELEPLRQDILRFISPEHRNGCSLEIGSGKGPLQGLTDKYVAFDYSASALQKYISTDHQRVCGSADSLPFPACSFDVVYSIAVLEHVPRVDLAFVEIDRVLRKGGIAYLAPAWHCIQDNCDGIPVRPYSDLDFWSTIRKSTFGFRQSLVVKGAIAVVSRTIRVLEWLLQSRSASSLKFKKLKANYKVFWMSDSDACSRIDRFEATLFFRSRGYEILSPGSSFMLQFFDRTTPLVVRKR